MAMVGRLHGFYNMLDKFEAYQIAKEFYWQSKKLRLPRGLSDQLLRASSSVALNLAEGSGRRTVNDQTNFYLTAYASLKECQAILELEQVEDKKLMESVDRLGGMLYKLAKINGKRVTE